MAEAVKSLSVSREYKDTIDIDMLQVADSIEMGTFDRPITPDERAAYGEKVIELSTSIEDAEDEKKATMKMFTDDIKLKKGDRKNVLRILRRGVEEVADKVHIFFDHDTLSVHTYNEHGKPVGFRRMRNDEKRTTPTIKP